MSDSVRRLDAQGRLLIPAHLRDQLAIGADTPLKISTDGQTIRVSPSGIRCSLCGEGGRDHRDLRRETDREIHLQEMCEKRLWNCPK